MGLRRPLLGASLVLLAVVMAMALVVAEAVSRPDPRGQTLAAPMAYGGPDGRLALNGPWVRADDPGDTGARRGWREGRFEGALVTVPDAANAGAVTGAAGRASYRGSVAWYRTRVTAPATGAFAIRFESVHHAASVWLDGKLLGQHTGAYLPFEFHVRLREGMAHTLVVRADYRHPTRMKRAGWHRTWFNFGGINREVTLRPLGASEILDPALTTRVLDGGAADVRVSALVRNRQASTRVLQVRGSLRRGTSIFPVELGSVRLAPGAERRVAGTVRLARPQLWEPGSPALYDLSIAAGDDPGWRARVGLRDLRWRGSWLELNGRRLRLHGASLHEDEDERGDALMPADMDALVADLRRTGANATRAQHALSPALLERLDAAGILVWQGVGPVDAPGAWTAQAPRQRKTARARVRASVAQLRMHPSIIAWNLINEVAGNGHDEGQVRYFTDLSRELHRTDPGRMVAIDVWGAHPPRGALGPIYREADAVAVTNYVGWYEDPLDTRSQIVRAIGARTRQFARTFRGKVLIISEFGAESNGANASAVPGGFGYQSWLLRQHIKVYRKVRSLSGMLVWDLRDFALTPDFAGGSITKVVPGIRVTRGINQKGLFDYAGRPKPAAAVVRRAFAPLGDGLSAR